MRKSASEILRNLESRIARLERKAGKSDLTFRGARVLSCWVYLEKGFDQAHYIATLNADMERQKMSRYGLYENKRKTFTVVAETKGRHYNTHEITYIAIDEDSNFDAGMDYLDKYLVKVDDLDDTLDARKARNSQKAVEHELITKNKI